MSMWENIKRGFGYAFGGRIGWELGGFVWRWVSRFVGLLMLGALGSLGMCTGDGVGSSVKTYNDYAKSHPIQKQHNEERR